METADLDKLQYMLSITRILSDIIYRGQRDQGLPDDIVTFKTKQTELSDLYNAPPSFKQTNPLECYHIEWYINYKFGPQ